MLTVAQRSDFVAANADLDTVAKARLTELAAMVDASAPYDAIVAMVEALPPLVAELSDVSSLLAAGAYDLSREQSPARGVYQATLADPVPVEQIVASARWAGAPLFAAPEASPDGMATGEAVAVPASHS